MDAAWKDAQFGVSPVRPDFLSVTQSQYGFCAFTDGYYFNVVRSLPVTSGHGGYSRLRSLASSTPRTFWRWPGLAISAAELVPADLVRQHDQRPVPPGTVPVLPDQHSGHDVAARPRALAAGQSQGRQGIVESNHLMNRLGTIFTTMPVTRPPVAMLYSLSQMIHDQTKDRNVNYAHEIRRRKNLPLTYLAGKLLQQQFMPVLDEDVPDGTLAASHKALDPHVDRLPRSRSGARHRGVRQAGRSGPADSRLSVENRRRGQARRDTALSPGSQDSRIDGGEEV